MAFRQTLVSAGVLVAVTATGTVAATYGDFFRGAGPGGAEVRCPGGMTRLGHEFNQDISVFPGDPAIRIEDEYTIVEDFFLVEDIDTGAHAGTHIDVPAHFIEGGRSLEELSADEFVWPAYKMDVRGMTFEDNFVQVADIRAYEQAHGRIPRGALVILQTGAEEFFGLFGPHDAYAVDADDNSDNTDDLFDFVNPGFSGEAVQWMFDRRRIDGVGADAYGPDAATDPNFSATFTTLFNDGIALVAMANVDSLNVRGDVIMAPAVALTDGSGFSVDPLACHARPRRGR